MFGMGFTEILFVAVIAIIFLGPDKLPEAMVQIAKFFTSFKKTVSDAKSSFEQEIHINELKEEALSYKRTLDNDITGFKNSLSSPIDDLNEALADLDEKKSTKDNYKTSQKQVSGGKEVEAVKKIKKVTKPKIEKPKAKKKQKQKNRKRETKDEI